MGAMDDDEREEVMREMDVERWPALKEWLVNQPHTPPTDSKPDDMDELRRRLECLS